MFTSLGFQPEDNQQPQPTSNRSAPGPAFQQPQLPQPGFGGFRQAAPEGDAGKSMLTPLDAHDRTTELLTNTAIPEPLSNGTHIPTPQPRQTGPSSQDAVSERMNSMVPRGFSAPRSGVGQGVNTQMRMQGVAPTGGFSGAQTPSWNGTSSGMVQKQWGQSPPGPSVAPNASGLGTSQGHIMRAQGMSVTAPRPGQQ